MTRINLIPPEELENMHLMAEYRELPRIFQLATNYYNSGKYHSKNDIPKEYTLGTGHVKFFYDKLLFLINRQNDLIKELKKRGYQIKFDDITDKTKNLPKDLLGDYIPTQEAIKINKARIMIRLEEYRIKNLKV